MSPLFISLILRQLIANFLADFIFQKDTLARKKDKEGWKSRTLYYHAGLVTILSFCFSFSVGFWRWALLIGVSHLFIDGIRSWFNPQLKVWNRVPLDRISSISEFLSLRVLSPNFLAIPAISFISPFLSPVRINVSMMFFNLDRSNLQINPII